MDLEPSDLGDCADKNNETFAKRHSEKREGKRATTAGGRRGGPRALRWELLKGQKDTSDHSKW